MDMTGYVTPQKSELRMREYELYSAYYCAICRSIGKRYGQLPRLLLSWDAVFIAMLIDALLEDDEEISQFRCATHPLKRRVEAASSHGVDYAADMLLLLGWFNIKDDQMDGGRPLSNIGSIVLKKTFKKLEVKYPQKTGLISSHLEALNIIEKEKNPNIDEAAEPFALIMEETLDVPVAPGAVPHHDGISDEGFADALKTAYRKIGYYLGKWIYIVDAIDDLGHDRKSGNYNPLKYWVFKSVEACGREAAEENAGDGLSPEAARLRWVMRMCLTAISETMALMPFKKNLPILENIVYVGLNAKTDEMVKKFIETANAAVEKKREKTAVNKGE